jgi:hypothetical protein
MRKHDRLFKSVLPRLRRPATHQAILLERLRLQCNTRTRGDVPPGRFRDGKHGTEHSGDARRHYQPNHCVGREPAGLLRGFGNIYTGAAARRFSNVTGLVVQTVSPPFPIGSVPGQVVHRPHRLHHRARHWDVGSIPMQSSARLCEMSPELGNRPGMCGGERKPVRSHDKARSSQLSRAADRLRAAGSAWSSTR